MTITPPVKLPMLQLDELTDEQKLRIHRATQLAVVSAASGRSLLSDWKSELGELADQHVFGLFVTLARGKQLRGCCGFLGKPTPLAEAILESAKRTVHDDVRMAPISPAEVRYLKVDISLLASPVVIKGVPADRVKGIEIGKHGVRITRGNQAGLLLPTVASEQSWDAKQFLEAVCRKAGMHEASWQDASAVLEVFDGIVIEGKIAEDVVPSNLPVVLPPGTVQELGRLKQVVAQNLIAFTQGGTPSYVSLGALEGHVNGVVLTLRDSDENKMLANWIHTSLRPGFALQNSLFELCRYAAETLARTRFERKVNIEAEVTVLYDPIHHGNLLFEDWDGDSLKKELVECEVDEVRPDNRAIVTLAADRCAVSFDSTKSVHELVQSAALPLRIRKNPVAVFSMQCMSTLSTLVASNAPTTLNSDIARQPAVAGNFYPTSKSGRTIYLEDFQSKEPISQRKVLGLMTPHAGIQYSGNIATKVWEQVDLPETLLIFGPKHTKFGADWAVSPSKEWALPEAEPWSANLGLAKAVAEGVEGMELDLNAHYLEYGIEVQLPILEALLRDKTPPRITAVVLRDASWPEIQQLSEQLAKVLQSQEEMPLLVISSDMNHFLPLLENRRRDMLALEAMETGDPLHLLEVCRSHQISMCGVVPAAIVMQTLKCLGKKFKVERVAYETSAQRGGDANQVVGYAGTLIVEG